MTSPTRSDLSTSGVPDLDVETTWMNVVKIAIDALEQVADPAAPPDMNISSASGAVTEAVFRTLQMLPMGSSIFPIGQSEGGFAVERDRRLDSVPPETSLLRGLVRLFRGLTPLQSTQGPLLPPDILDHFVNLRNVTTVLPGVRHLRTLNELAGILALAIYATQVLCPDNQKTRLQAMMKKVPTKDSRRFTILKIFRRDGLQDALYGRPRQRLGYQESMQRFHERSRTTALTTADFVNEDLADLSWFMGAALKPVEELQNHVQESNPEKQASESEGEINETSTPVTGSFSISPESRLRRHVDGLKAEISSLERELEETRARDREDAISDRVVRALREKVSIKQEETYRQESELALQTENLLAATEEDNKLRLEHLQIRNGDKSYQEELQTVLREADTLEKHTRVLRDEKLKAQRDSRRYEDEANVLSQQLEKSSSEIDRLKEECSYYRSKGPATEAGIGKVSGGTHYTNK